MHSEVKANKGQPAKCKQGTGRLIFYSHTEYTQEIHTRDMLFCTFTQMIRGSLACSCFTSHYLGCVANDVSTWWTVFSIKAFITDALAVHAPAVTDAIVQTLLGAAVVPCEVWETHALSIHAVPLVVAVTRTGQLVAVVPCVALVTHALAAHTPPVIVALVRTGGHWAVWTFPPQVAHAAAGLLLVHTVATTACVQASRKKVSSCYFMACE